MNANGTTPTPHGRTDADAHDRADAPPLVSVVVPVHDDAEHLRGCLAALRRQVVPAAQVEILVADDASSDAPEHVCAEFGARCLRRPRGGSYAARNAALREARGAVLAFTDADCRPDAHWLERGLARLEQDPAIGVLAGPVRLFCADPQAPTVAERYELATAFPQRAYAEEGHWGATANLFVRRAVFERVGGFDDTLRSGGDKEWGQRAYRNGVRVAFVADAVVDHPARSTTDALTLKERRVADGLVALARRAEAPRRARLRRLATTVRDGLRQAIELARRPDVPRGQRLPLVLLHLRLRGLRVLRLVRG